MRYYLNQLYNLVSFRSALNTELTNNALLMGADFSSYNDTLGFVASAIYLYFFEDLVAYETFDEDIDEVKANFINRISYDIAVKLPYWYRKYNEIKSLLTTDDLSLLQTSRVISSSQDKTDSAGGSLQKVATTPSGISTETSEDRFEISIDSDSDTSVNEIDTLGFVDKYTNTQQKYANTSRIEGNRSGDIYREGSIEELLKVLEKLPSSFADEITREVSKHFIFVYDR